MTDAAPALTTNDQAHAVVRKYTYWATGLSILPMPLIDLAAVTGSQLMMLNEISKLYNQTFSENYGKIILSSLVSGLATTSMAFGRVGSLLKCLPLVGGVVGLLTMPAFAAASTHAVGNLFIMHFESGGSFLDFDLSKAKAHFEALVSEKMHKA